MGRGGRSQAVLPLTAVAPPVFIEVPLTIEERIAKAIEDNDLDKAFQLKLQKALG